MPLDLTQPLPDLEADAPAGPNLEFDGAFGELERTAQGTPERQAGDKIIPAEDPVWKDVATQAMQLLERTYDLRVLTHLAVARLNQTGLADFAGALTAIANLLDSRWDHVHPQLDPEDDNDPAVRANALLPLASPTRVLRALRALPIAVSKRAGPVTWRTIALALGEAETPEGQERPSEAEIRAAFAETPPARIEAMRDQVAAALQACKGITTAFDTHSGFGNQPDLTALTKALHDIGRYIGRYYVADAEETASQDGGAVGETDEAADAGDADFAADAAPAAARRAGGGGMNIRALSSVGSRADALYLLDLVCRYFEQNEPSSPLPLMLTRARGLADKTFLEILQDLAPDGLGQAQVVVQSREG